MDDAFAETVELEQGVLSLGSSRRVFPHSQGRNRHSSTVREERPILERRLAFSDYWSLPPGEDGSVATSAVSSSRTMTTGSMGKCGQEVGNGLL
jgi:hypothetical protein